MKSLLVRCICILSLIFILFGCEQPKTTIDKPLPEGAYKAEIIVLNPPNTIKSGTKQKVNVKVKNISNTLWPSQGLPDERFKIHLGDHWLDSNGKLIIRDSSRAVLPHDLKPGSEVTIAINIIAPPTPGDYILEYDMVQEAVTWFAGKGSKTARINIKVE